MRSLKQSPGRTATATSVCRQQRKQQKEDDEEERKRWSRAEVSTARWHILILSLLICHLLQNVESTSAFTTTQVSRSASPHAPPFARGCMSTTMTTTKTVRWAASPTDDHDDDDDDDDDDTHPSGNPYADPNYPDLEFVNYDDPEYQVDQGVGDEFFDATQTEQQVEMMREERRVRNDEFQFETYYRDILKNGQEFKGEWMVYHTSTFTDKDLGANGRPRLAKAAGPLKVISRGERIEVDDIDMDDDDDDDNDASTSGKTEMTTNTKKRLHRQRIIHHERIYTDSDPSSGEEKGVELLKQEQLSMDNKFWPEQLSFKDFRGHQGIMCVGSSYTICTAKQLDDGPEGESRPVHEGPFSEYKVELGLLDDVLRFRIKIDYSVLEDEKKSSSEGSSISSSPSLPPLHLKSLTVCRETLGMWPRAEKYKSAIEAVTSEALWGPRGAQGGLYDPPPVGSAEQASQYLLLDLEGRATVLLPYLMDQDPTVHGPDSGWVTSLDWTPGKNRFQADRKTGSGKHLMGLRTLELTEVESASAETYRPRDGGQDMRQ